MEVKPKPPAERPFWNQDEADAHLLAAYPALAGIREASKRILDEALRVTSCVNCRKHVG